MSTIRYALTDRSQYGETEPKRHAALVAQAKRLAAEGVDYIQLREKDLPAQDLIGLTREILSGIRQERALTRLLINARADVALAGGAHGVHLTSSEDQLTPGQIRELYNSAGAAKPVISVSCHSLDEVARAEEGGADLILFGPVFGKSIAGTIVVPETGVAALTAACEVAKETPVLALGGVTADNTAVCLQAGAGGIAAIRIFC